MAATACSRSENVSTNPYPACIGSGNTLKRPRQKSVTWPIDEKICEVRCFLGDDAPSCLLVPSRELAQYQQGNPLPYNKANVPSSSLVMGVKRPRMEQDPYLMDVPSAFGPTSTAGKSPQLNDHPNVAMTITVSWYPPRKFLVDASWMWAEGEESLEFTSQQEREMRSLEAFYSRSASIPDSPFEPLESCKQTNDALMAQIPLVPIEEEMDDEEKEPQSHSAEKGGSVLYMSEQRKTAASPVPLDVNSHEAYTKRHEDSSVMIGDANIAAAAAVALFAVKALGESDLVDEALLFELLKNPSLLQSLRCANSGMNGASQDQDGPTVIKPAAHQEHPIHKLHADQGAYLDSSPVSVLAQWADPVGINNCHKMAPIACASTQMQQTTSMSSVSIGLLSSASTSTRYPCSGPESYHKNPAQLLVECIPRMHKQIDNISTNTLLSQPKSNESSLMLSCISKEATRSQSALSKASPTGGQDVISSSSVHATSRALSQPSRMQFDLPKHLPAENPSCPGRTGAYSMPSKTGGRATRPCMYFNTPRGCRNGQSCAFVH